MKSSRRRRPTPKVRFNRFNKMTLGSKISFIVILLLIIAAVFAPVITPYSPMAITEAIRPDGRPPVRHRQPWP